MSISRNDPFDLNLCIRGLGNLITLIHSHVYSYMYYLTFKRALKSHSQEFNDPWESGIDDLQFFENVDDSFVKCCMKAQVKLIDFKIELMLRFGINEHEDVIDEVIITQQDRYKPYFLFHMRAKTYKALKKYYERTLSESINSIYLYACAITANSYKIPLLLKKQLDHPVQDPLRLLNHDDNNVALLTQLITGLRRDLEVFKGLAAITSKVERDRYFKDSLI
jgi:hypothetical protein